MSFMHQSIPAAPTLPPPARADPRALAFFLPWICLMFFHSNWSFAFSFGLIYIFAGAHGELGSFSNSDGDGNENVQKAIALLSKTTNLHVHVRFSAVSTRLRRENAEFHVNKRRRIFLSLSKF